MSLQLSTYQIICLSMDPAIYLSSYRPIQISIYPTIYQSIFLSIHISICPVSIQLKCFTSKRMTTVLLWMLVLLLVLMMMVMVMMIMMTMMMIAGGKSLHIRNSRNGDFWTTKQWVTSKPDSPQWLPNIWCYTKQWTSQSFLHQDGEYAYTYETDDVQWTPLNSNLQMQGIKVLNLNKQTSENLSVF